MRFALPPSIVSSFYVRAAYDGTVRYLDPGTCSQSPDPAPPSPWLPQTGPAPWPISPRLTPLANRHAGALSPRARSLADELTLTPALREKPS